MHYGPHHKPLPCAANPLCHKHALELKIWQQEFRINQEMNARGIAEEIAKENYNAYDRERVQSERNDMRLDQLAESIQVLSEEKGRERDYAAVQRDALARKAKQLEGECERLEGRCEQLAQENAKLKQVLSQGGNEGGGVPQVSAESRKRKRT